MTKCPKCAKEVSKPEKTWKYGIFTVQVFSCGHCGTKFRDYVEKGKHSFTLKLQKGKGFVKA
jgi:DNA-directed RNA polymerase subunit RPC12/RpoP